MYLGRMVAIGQTAGGINAVMYRISSESYQNRRITDLYRQKTLSVVPRKGYEEDALGNPYLTYNAVRICEDRWAVAGNGSHVDSIAEKILQGFPLLDAIGSTLLAFGYEKDRQKTPRLVGIVGVNEPCGWLGFIGENKHWVERVPLIPERCLYLAIGRDSVGRGSFLPKSSKEITTHLIKGRDFKKFENPVATAVAYSNGSSFELDYYNAPIPTG